MNFIFDNDRPIYVQLVEQLTIYIISGKISLGERLPSVRDLALQLRVNPNTVQKALSELEDLKLIYTERTNGKYITTDENLIKEIRLDIVKSKTNNYLLEMNNLGFSNKDIEKYIKGRGNE